MTPRPRHEYRVQVTPTETGYTLSVAGLRQFKVSDGYEGSLDQAARDLIAAEVGQEADSIAVLLRYDLMGKYRGSAHFSWPILLFALVALSAAAAGLIMGEPLLASIASFAAFVLIVARLVGTKHLNSPL